MFRIGGQGLFATSPYPEPRESNTPMDQISLALKVSA